MFFINFLVCVEASKLRIIKISCKASDDFKNVLSNNIWKQGSWIVDKKKENLKSYLSVDK